MRPALVVCAAAHPHAEEFYKSLIGHHDGPLIAADGGAGLCLAHGRVPDLLVGDLDSISSDLLERTRSAGTKVVQARADKDETDLDLALQGASDLGAERVLITAAWSERLDHTLAAIGSVFAYTGLTIDLIDPGMSGCVLDSQARRTATLSGPGASFSLFTLDSGTVVSCVGARYELADATLQPLSARGLSNVLLDAPAVVRAVRGRLLVVSHVVDGICHASISSGPE
jgi:thiamine pyrophosphokinase